MKTNKNKSHMAWAWVLMVTFLTLSIIDFRFGILGFACMGAPIYHALRGRGKVHCRKYCPRGSLLGKFLPKISLGKTMPKFMLTRKFRNGLLILMLSVFTFAMSHTGGNFYKIAFTMFRFMTVSLIVGILMGIIFKPRSWCAVCPMAHGSMLIDEQLKRSKEKGNKKPSEGAPVFEIDKEEKKKKAA